MHTTTTESQVLLMEQIQGELWNDDDNQHFCQNCCHKFHWIEYNQEAMLCDTCFELQELAKELTPDLDLYTITHNEILPG